jgi:tetratricopeptide (TPR) repeat protein
MRKCQTLFLTAIRRARIASLSICIPALLLAACSNDEREAYAAGQEAQSLFDAGDLPGARAAIGRAIALRDDQIDLLLLDGRIKFAMRDFEAAFDSYGVALAIDPTNTEALQAISQIGVSIGAERESEEATDRILALQPKQADALLVKGIHALNRRKFVDAQTFGETLLASNPQSEGGVVLKARGMFLAGRRAEALALLNDAIKRIGRTQMIATALLECARDQAQTSIMIEQFALLRQLVPKNADLALDETNILYKSGMNAQARDRGFSVLTDNGADFESMQRLRDLWSEYDRTPLSTTQLQSLAENGAPAARIMTARYYLGLGDSGNAGAVIKAVQGDIVDGLRLRIAYASGSTTAAAQVQRLLQRDKTNCDALAVRYAVAMKAKRSADAVTDAQLIASECPDSEDGFLMLADAYMQGNRASGVERAYTDGIGALPLSSLMVERYTGWLIQNRRSEAAVMVARRLTQRAPAKLSAWALFANVCRQAADKNCLAEAATGEAAARKNFQIDLPPGQRRPNPLLGNYWR